MRTAVGDGWTELEDPTRKVKLDAILRASGLLATPEKFSAKELVVEIAKAMMNARFNGLGLSPFDQLSSQLPAVRSFQSALLSPALDNVKGTSSYAIAPSGIDRQELAREVEKQVFDIKCDR
jgi:hypothetical protein